MGVAGAIISTLAMGYLQGKSQQDAMNAQAAQAEANARIANMNAEKAEQQAKEQDQNNKVNEENQRRKNLLMLGQQNAAIGASGITATGSALNAMMESRQEVDTESGIQSYNNRQKVQNILDQSTEQVNYRNMYNQQADNYRSAGRAAMTNAMLGSVFSLAGSLYTPSSAATQTATGPSTAGGQIGGATKNWMYGPSNATLTNMKTGSSSGWSMYQGKRYF